MIDEVSALLTKRLVLVVLTGTFVTVGLGFGVLSPAIIDAPSQPATLGPATLPTVDSDLPAPPDVTGGTPGVGGPTTPPTTTTTAVPLQPAITVALADLPERVASDAGTVHDVRPSLSGTLSLARPLEARTDATVVVQTWTPESGWATVDRATATLSPGTTTVALAELRGGDTLAYASGARAAEYDNPEDGTTARRRGAVAVTVVLSRGGERLTTTGATTEFAFRVANLEDERDDGAEGSIARPHLLLDRRASDPTLFRATTVAPGDRSGATLEVTNDGEAAGTLVVGVANLSSSENGWTEPEAAVDHDRESELPAHLLVRVAVHRDGDVRYLVGGTDRMVRFAALEEGSLGSVPLGVDENATVQVEWYVEREADNEIQTDAVGVDLTVSLREPSPSLLASATSVGGPLSFRRADTLDQRARIAENPSTIRHLEVNPSGG